MANLPDINIGALSGSPETQIASIVQQLNEWGRLVSNEDITRVTRSNAGVEAITIGELPNQLNGILIRDETSTPRGIFGEAPDGSIIIAISKEGENVLDNI